MSIESVILSNHLILCAPLLLLPLIFPSLRVLSGESALDIREPKYWSYSFSINPSNEYSGLISFRIDWFDLFTVQGILKSLFQHHSLKASILHCSAFFVIQLSHLQGANTVSKIHLPPFSSATVFHLNLCGIVSFILLCVHFLPPLGLVCAIFKDKYNDLLTSVPHLLSDLLSSLCCSRTCWVLDRHF